MVDDLRDELVFCPRCGAHTEVVASLPRPSMHGGKIIDQYAVECSACGGMFLVTPTDDDEVTEMVDNDE
ncbi:MAG: hypothetical protein PHI12_07945 [Dehalococcoidales bacterium]|jgi:uncharacterized Zn finger protein|nr:hypothetical protein [Sphaerochaeta sp.]MDD5510725.1 hypothetical protein [Dehalococcoidales bacterium]